MWPSGESGPSSAAPRDEHVEPAEALRQRAAQPIDRLRIGEVERHQRRPAAGGTHLVVDLLERPRRARHQDQRRALGGEAFGKRRAKPAARSGDQRDAPLEPAQLTRP